MTDENVMHEIKNLRREVNNLAAIQKIRDLKHRYWFICDHFMHGKMAEVFTRDARVAMGPFGILKGKEGVTEFFEKHYWPNVEMVLHGGHNPMIELTSDTTAKGTWNFECYSIIKGEKPSSLWMTGRYDDEYEIEDGEWRIATQTGAYYFTTTDEPGYIRDRFSSYMGIPVAENLRMTRAETPVGGFVNARGSG